MFSSKVLILISLFTFFQFYSLICRYSKVHYSAGFYGWTSLAEIMGSIYISKSQCASHSQVQILVCIYTICSYGQMYISYTILLGSIFPSCCVAIIIRVFHISVSWWSFNFFFFYLIYFSLLLSHIPLLSFLSSTTTTTTTSQPSRLGQ